MGRLQLRFFNTWDHPSQLTWNSLPSILLGFVVESLLYGMHVILFMVCAYILVRRRRKQQMLLLAAAVVMFILATADVGISWNILLRDTTLLHTGDTATALDKIYPKFLIYIVNNLIADVLLVLRCYVVWDRKKIIFIPSSIVLVIGTVFGFIGEGTVSVPLKKYVLVYIIMIVLFNLFLTLLTAGGIYKIARDVKCILGREMSSQYQFAIAIVVESGLIYTISNILVLSLSQTRFIVMTTALSIRIVCIMPLLIIVQVTLGRSTNPKDVKMTTAAHQQTPLVFNTIVSNDRYDSEGQRIIHRPSLIESARGELQVPLADGSVNKEQQGEGKIEEI